MFGRINTFLMESRQELRHVNWPTRKEAVRLTAIVIIMSVLFAAFLGGFDYIFSALIKNIIVF